MDALNQWLISNQVTRCTFARSIGLTNGHFSNMMNGKRAIDYDLAVRISIGTNFQLSVAEVVDPRKRIAGVDVTVAPALLP